MDFKKATEELMAGMTREQIAEALGVSEATVRQARLEAGTKAHRNPPGRVGTKAGKGSPQACRTPRQAG